jgi:hypothetical protein
MTTVIWDMDEYEVMRMTWMKEIRPGWNEATGNLKGGILLYGCFCDGL